MHLYRDWIKTPVPFLFLSPPHLKQWDPYGGRLNTPKNTVSSYERGTVGGTRLMYSDVFDAHFFREEKIKVFFKSQNLITPSQISYLLFC